MLSRWFGAPTMSDVDRQLPRAVRTDRRSRTLVVLASSQRQVDALKIDRSPWAKARVVPIVGRSTAEAHDTLAALPGVGLVVDARRSSDAVRLGTFERLFFHLDPKGAWVALRPGRRAPTPEPLVKRAKALDDPKARRRLQKTWREHVRAVDDVRVTPRMVVLGKRRRHLLRMRDSDALHLLPSREPGLRVTEIARLDAGVIDNSGLATEYGGSPEPRVPDLLPYPVHEVRRYDGPVHTPRAAFVHHGRSALPESSGGTWTSFRRPTASSTSTSTSAISGTPRRGGRSTGPIPLPLQQPRPLRAPDDRGDGEALGMVARQGC